MTEALRRRYRLALAGMAGLALACGGGTPSGPGTPPPPGPPPPPPPPAPVLFDAPIEGAPGATVYYGAFLDLGSRDYNCGIKYYSGHGGIDILLRNFEVQDSGVRVLAAAAGTVIFTRQDLPDRNTVNGSGGLGNHVIIDHGGGVVSSYGHLRANSLLVALNQQVVAGQPLGLVGSSGNSNWPHLHFEVSVSNARREPTTGSCNAVATMWRNQLPYPNLFAVADAGLTLQEPVGFAQLLEGPPRAAQVPGGNGTALVWYNLANVNTDSARVVVRSAGGVAVNTRAIGRLVTFSNTFISWRFPVAGFLAPGVHQLELWQRSPPGGPLQLSHTLGFVVTAPAPGAGVEPQVAELPREGRLDVWQSGGDRPF